MTEKTDAEFIAECEAKWIICPAPESIIWQPILSDAIGRLKRANQQWSTRYDSAGGGLMALVDMGSVKIAHLEIKIAELKELLRKCYNSIDLYAATTEGGLPHWRNDPSTKRVEEILNQP